MVDPNFDIRKLVDSWKIERFDWIFIKTVIIFKIKIKKFTYVNDFQEQKGSGDWFLKNINRR